MKYYSTNGNAPLASLEMAVVKGLAEDRGLYMPQRIKRLPDEFFADMASMSFHDVAYNVASAFFGEDIDLDVLQDLVRDTLSFPVPLVRVSDSIYSLELFHGPTLAFKDVGARFMARLLSFFIRQNPAADARGEINVLVATSGDTGSAVANGFLAVPGIHVYVLYPKGKVSPIQECQFTTLGQNITAVEVDGTFDDCQRLVKSAFMDEALNRHMQLTSANSINVARFLPQAFYYFWAVAQLRALRPDVSPEQIVISVPSGNFGNICAGLFGRRMGLPVGRFIAANNANDVFFQYLQSGQYVPHPSVQTIANAMDVGDPSNFARILDLYGQSHEAICRDISGATFSDGQIGETMCRCLRETGYQLDPHGACGYAALYEGLRQGEVGIFLETAHPAKFRETVHDITGADVPVPERLAAFMQGIKQSVPMTARFEDFQSFLLAR